MKWQSLIKHWPKQIEWYRLVFYLIYNNVRFLMKSPFMDHTIPIYLNDIVDIKLIFQ